MLGLFLLTTIQLDSVFKTYTLRINNEADANPFKSRRRFDEDSCRENVLVSCFLGILGFNPVIVDTTVGLYVLKNRVNK